MLIKVKEEGKENGRQRVAGGLCNQGTYGPHPHSSFFDFWESGGSLFPSSLTPPVPLIFFISVFSPYKYKLTPNSITFSFLCFIIPHFHLPYQTKPALVGHTFHK